MIEHECDYIAWGVMNFLDTVDSTIEQHILTGN